MEVSDGLYLFQSGARSGIAVGARLLGLDAAHFAQRSYAAAEAAQFGEERDRRMTGMGAVKSHRAVWMPLTLRSKVSGGRIRAVL